MSKIECEIIPGLVLHVYKGEQVGHRSGFAITYETTGVASCLNVDGLYEFTCKGDFDLYGLLEQQNKKLYKFKGAKSERRR